MGGVRGVIWFVWVVEFEYVGWWYWCFDWYVVGYWYFGVDDEGKEFFGYYVVFEFGGDLEGFFDFWLLRLVIRFF